MKYEVNRVINYHSLSGVVICAVVLCTMLSTMFPADQFKLATEYV